MSSFDYLGRDVNDWRAMAAAKLDLQATQARMLQGYYDGLPAVIALLDTEERNAFRRFLSESRANWCALVVNAVAERLQVVGFRFGDQATDDLAWQIWQASAMDADSELVQTDALVQASSYVLVQADESNPTGVEICGESSMQAAVLYEPGSRRKRRAGYKRFLDYGETVEVLILPDLVVTYAGESADPVGVEPNPMGVVNLVEMRPQPCTIGRGRSELDPAIPFQDRINTTIFNRMVATDYGAFRQIWATGVRMARQVLTAADGSQSEVVVKPFNVGANRLLANENPDARFGSFPESTLAGYLNSVEQDVQQLAAITQTPPHYLLGQMVNISGDAIKAAEAGLVAKVSQRALHIGEDWEEVMRLALGLVGNPAAVNVAAEVVWKDFETRSESQLVDSLVKAATIGVPQEVLWQRYGATPQQVREWKQQNMTAAAQAAATQAVAFGAADPYTQLVTGGAGGG